MVKDREERVFCIWLKVGTILSVQPINDFACKGFSKFAVNKSVIYGVWLTAVDAIFDLNRCDYIIQQLTIIIRVMIYTTSTLRSSRFLFFSRRRDRRSERAWMNKKLERLRFWKLLYNFVTLNTLFFSHMTS